MRIRKATLALLLTLVSPLVTADVLAQIAPVGDGVSGPVQAQHLTAQIVSLGSAIAPGGTQQIGLLLTLEAHWHVYWINPGDSGEPPKIVWRLPAGVTAGAMQFPIPKRLPLGPLMDYGYENEVAFPITISAAPTLKTGPVHLDAEVSWLVCNNVCIPGKAQLGIDLAVDPNATQSPPTGALGDALSLIPKPLPAEASLTINGGKQSFVLTLVDGKRERNAEFYPYPADLASETNAIVYSADQRVESQSDGVRLFMQRSPDLARLPATMHGVLKLSDRVAYEVTAPVIAGDVLPASSGSAPLSQSIGAIALAFLGGMILNLMPCVFPVLFLKGLTLVQSTGQSRAHLRSHGLVYTLGILVSFWAIVAALLVVRATGGHAGWGFQLQSPTFIALLASLIFFLALSLAGQFEIGLSLTSVGSSLVDNPSSARQGYASSFFTGVLATVVATPCTAPLMGAAIGFALAQSAVVTFAVFTALALGLAAPYLALSWQPAWVSVLPRPGAWMETLKQLTAVPLFATAIWLAWVYGQLHASSGVDQIALLLACFLVLSIAGWTLGRWPARGASTIAAFVLIAIALAIPLSQSRKTAAPTAPSLSSSSAAALDWQPYSEAALASARSNGHAVFIDFTADWCLSCKFNEQAVLRSTEVESALRAHNVTLLKADWTNSDPAITAKLASLGRAGVPTYVLYPAATASSADVLPELLTKSLVLAAIERDAKP